MRFSEVYAVYAVYAVYGGLCGLVSPDLSKVIIYVLTYIAIKNTGAKIFVTFHENLVKSKLQLETNKYKQKIMDGFIFPE